MHFTLKAIALFTLGMALAACQSSSEAQTLRERLQDRSDASGEVAGGETITITVGGQSRSFIVATPPSGRASSAVLVFHGGQGSADRMFANNTIKDAAAAQDFLAVYPNAINKTWTDGRSSTADGPDDVAFTRAIIAEISARYGVDPNRVFATGISNGAMMTYRLACDAPGLVRAIAPVAATLPEVQLPRCAGAAATPVMMFFGTDDPVIPFAGGQMGQDSRRLARVLSGQDPVTSARDTAAFWAAVNSCGTSSATALTDNFSDGTTVTRLSYSCPASAQVVLYQIDGGGHTWPGSASDGSRVVGAVSREIDASATMLGFFRSYGL